MTENYSWILHKQTGTKPFSYYLNEANISHYLYTWDDTPLKEKNASIFSNPSDSIVKGVAKGDARFFFVQVGVSLTPSFQGYTVFIFDHHPRDEEIDMVCRELESVILNDLDKVDITPLLNALSEAKENPL
jgi:hypothetical protein